MRLLSKDGIVPRAVPFRTISGEPLVRLRCGAIWYALCPDEAADLAQQLIECADELKAADRSEGVDEDFPGT
jgi:DNA-binding IclR family transcriptional regulator